MTRKHFRRLISGIYLISTGIGISISLIALYSKLGSDYSTPLTWLAVFEFWTLLLPALVTCIIVGLVRLTNKIEPLSEEERQQSFVERLSKTQLFIPLSLLLAVPSAFLASTIPDIWIRGFFRVFSIFIAVHLFITWLLVLLLRRTTRIRKTGWKIVLILLFILSTIAYILVSTIACDLASTDAFYWSESHRRSTSDNREYTESDAQRETPDCPDEEVVVSEETAERLADDAMYIYNQYDWAALGEDYVYSFVMECSEILEYNPNAIYTPCILTSPEEIGEEKYREFAARDSMRFVVKQRLSRFYHQVFHSDYEDFDSEDFDTMLWWLKKALLKRKDAIDYNFFAKRVDMLDLAWRELNALGEKNGRDAFTDLQLCKRGRHVSALARIRRLHHQSLCTLHGQQKFRRSISVALGLYVLGAAFQRRNQRHVAHTPRSNTRRVSERTLSAETVLQPDRNIARPKRGLPSLSTWYKPITGRSRS